jgi:hypothetical protein
MSIHALRARVESSLAGRIAAPFAYRDRRIVNTVSSGIPEIDQLAGGLPRGGVTEICGPPCSGRTSVLLAALAARTAQAEACALVDGRDCFDPQAAKAAGVRLEQLLWVRCENIEQALHATDLLLRGGGFGLVALDLADIDPRTVRGVQLNTWFRFRRAVENTPSILLLIEQESNAKTCASLVLGLSSEPARWAPECSSEASLSWTRLLGGFGVRAAMVHVRIQAAQEIVFPGASPQRAVPGIFETRTEWSVLAETG